jgi:hypothetical protein
VFALLRCFPDAAGDKIVRLRDPMTVITDGCQLSIRWWNDPNKFELIVTNKFELIVMRANEWRKLMIARSLLALILTVGSSLLAQAQYNSDAGTAGPSVNQTMAGDQVHQIPQTIQKELQSAGFRDVQVMPSSFLVTAKDKNGHPVMIRIGPHSTTILTEVPFSDSSTTGSGSSNQPDTPRSGNSQ